MKVIKSLYNKIFNHLFNRCGANFHLTDGFANKFLGVRISRGNKTIEMGSLIIRAFYFSILTRQIVSRFSAQNLDVYENSRCRMSLDKADINVRIKSKKRFQIEITLPHYGTLHVKRIDQEVFFKVSMSKDEILDILPEGIPQKRTIGECVENGIVILAYVDNSDKYRFPYLKYIVNGFTPKTANDQIAHSFKQTIIATLTSRNHIAKSYLRYEDFPKLVRSVVICAEDPAYMLHRGVCPYAMGLIVRSLMSKRLPSGGGSTITQQLIRNTFFTGETSAIRKVREMAMALIAENFYRLSKHDILELYLNMVESGNGVFGFGDASRHYFDKPLSDLSVIEVLVLTYILPRAEYFEDALVRQTAQLKNNLKEYILKFLPILVNKNVISGIPDNWPIDGVSFCKPFGYLPFDKPELLHRVDTIVIHCSATPFGVEANVDALRMMHLQRGFDDVGYHWIVKFTLSNC